MVRYNNQCNYVIESLDYNIIFLNISLNYLIFFIKKVIK